MKCVICSENDSIKHIYSSVNVTRNYVTNLFSSAATKNLIVSNKQIKDLRLLLSFICKTVPQDYACKTMQKTAVTFEFISKLR